MSIEKRIAKTLVRNIGREKALEDCKKELDRAMLLDSIKGIEEQHFWREVIMEIMGQK